MSELFRWRGLAAVIALLAVGAAVAGYVYLRSLAAPSPYQTSRLTRGPLVAAVSATGTLNAVVTVQVGSQVSGQIKELYADFNSPVKRGQVIAQIDPDIFVTQVNQARAQVEGAQAAVLNQEAMVAKTHSDLENCRAALAAAHAQTAKAQVAVVDGQRNLGREQELRQRNLIAQSDLDAAQVAADSAVAQHDSTVAQERAQGAAVESAEAQLRVAEAQLKAAQAQVGQSDAALRQAQLNLDHTIIRAPVNGVVVSRNVDVGQTVAASLQAPTLFLIAQDLSRMQVDTNVDEADVGRVRVGQAATFTVDSFPGRTFSGEVVQVREAPQVLQNVVTYDVVISASNGELKLLPGMTANVRIVTDRKEAVLRVPNAALRFRPPQATAEAPGSATTPGVAGQIWTVGPDGGLRAARLRLGISDGAFTEVLAGDVDEGQEAVVGVATTGTPAAPTTPITPRLRF